MTSHATAIPTRVFWDNQDSSLIRYPVNGHPNFGRRLDNYARTNPVYPYGNHAGESIFNPIPMHVAPPNLPLTANGCVDILAIIQPHVSTSDRTPAGRLAHKISNWASKLVSGDGVSYEKDTADGHGRAYPMPPNAGPLWQAPVPLVQPVNGVPIGQVLPAIRTRALTPCPYNLTRMHTLPRPMTQVDVIFALAKCNWHCGNPRCRRRLNPWAALGAVDAAHVARVDNYIYHDGLRGPTMADNNIQPELCCGLCMRKGEF